MNDSSGVMSPYLFLQFLKNLFTLCEICPIFKPSHWYTWIVSVEASLLSHLLCRIVLIVNTNKSALVTFTGNGHVVLENCMNLSAAVPLRNAIDGK